MKDDKVTGPAPFAVSLDGLPSEGSAMIPCADKEHAFSVIARGWADRMLETWQECNRNCAEDVGANPDDYEGDRGWFLETAANHGMMIFRRADNGWRHDADCVAA